MKRSGFATCLAAIVLTCPLMAATLSPTNERPNIVLMPRRFLSREPAISG